MQVLSSFPTICLTKLKILEILQDNNFTLDKIGEDFVQMLNFPLTSGLYLGTLVEELYILSAESYSDIKRRDIEHEIAQMYSDIEYRYRFYLGKNQQIRSIRFELPDTVIFDFAPSKLRTSNLAMRRLQLQNMRIHLKDLTPPTVDTRVIDVKKRKK